MKLAILVFAGLLGASSIARADNLPPERPERPQKGAALRALIIEAFDADGDGRLDPQERRRAGRALKRMAKRMNGQQQQNGPQQRGNRGGMRRQRLMQRFDRNGDGVLGPDEVPPRVQQRLRRFDRNGDGWLDRNDRPDRGAPPPAVPDQE